MAVENETKIRAAAGLNGTESPVKSPVGVPRLSKPRLRTKLPKFVHHERTRHGKSVYYVRRGTGRRIRLAGAPGTAEFTASYQAAIAGAVYEPPAAPAVVPTSSAAQASERHIRRIMRGAIERAAAKGRGFDLDLDWALAEVRSSGFKCPLTGIPYFMETTVPKRGVHPYAPSIDRIDSAKGYTKDNCRIVIFALNAMLLDWGEDIFRRVATGGSVRSAPADRKAGEGGGRSAADC